MTLLSLISGNVSWYLTRKLVHFRVLMQESVHFEVKFHTYSVISILFFLFMATVLFWNQLIKFCLASKYIMANLLYILLHHGGTRDRCHGQSSLYKLYCDQNNRPLPQFDLHYYTMTKHLGRSIIIISLYIIYAYIFQLSLYLLELSFSQ